MNESDVSLLGKLLPPLNILSGWVGLTRDTWKWSDSSNPSYLPWLSGQPDNFYTWENCGTAKDGLLMDEKCTNQYYFTCSACECFVFLDTTTSLFISAMKPIFGQKNKNKNWNEVVILLATAGAVGSVAAYFFYFLSSTDIVRKQIVRLQVKVNQSVLDPAVQTSTFEMVCYIMFLFFFNLYFGVCFKGLYTTMCFMFYDSSMYVISSRFLLPILLLTNPELSLDVWLVQLWSNFINHI